MDWDPFATNTAAQPAQAGQQQDFFAAFDAQPTPAASQQNAIPDMANNAGGDDLFAAMGNSATPQPDMFAAMSAQPASNSTPNMVSPAGDAASDPFMAMSFETAATPVAPAASQPAPSSAPAAPAADSDDMFAAMFAQPASTPQTAPTAPAPAPAPAPAQPVATDFDQIFTANASAPLSPTPAADATPSASDPFAMAFGGAPAPASAPAPAAVTAAVAAAAPNTEGRKRATSQEDLFSTAFGGQSLFASSPTASGPPARAPPAAPGNDGQPSSAWDAFGGGGGGDGLVDIGPDRGQVRCLDVAEGKRKESMMWARLQKLSGIPPAAALDVLEHGDDAAGQEAKAMSQISAEAIKSGTGKEPDGGAARLTKAIRNAEEGSREALMKCRSLQDKKVAVDAAIRLSNRDTILLVVLWLRETLKHDLFMDEISRRPIAVRVYAEYMRDTWRWEQLETFFVSIRATELVRYKDRPQLQRTDACVELAFCMIRRALSKSVPDEQISVLKEVCDYSKTVPRGTLWETSELEVVAGWCSDWMELTRRQVEVEKTDQGLASKAMNEAQRSPDISNLGTRDTEAAVPLFTRFPRSCVIGMSVLDFMQYLALYHANAKEDQIASPKGLRKAFGISEKLFWFAAFTSLAKVGMWDVVRRATESKSMFTTKTADKSPIGWRPLFNLVFEYGNALGDPELRRLATHFANHMEDRTEAANLCVQKTLWEGAIQACVDLRDEDRLIDLRVHIAQEEQGDTRPYIQMIDEVYKDTRIKWKTDASTTAKTVLGSKTLAGFTSIFSKKPVVDTSKPGGLSNMFNKISGKNPTHLPQSSPKEHEHQQQSSQKNHVVFGGGSGGLVDDD